MAGKVLKENNMVEDDLTIVRLSAKDPSFENQLNAHLNREMLTNDGIVKVVNKILKDVRLKRDRAVIDYTNKFDNFSVNSLEELTVSSEQLKESLERVPYEQRQALEHAADRIKKYHEQQVSASW